MESKWRGANGEVGGEAGDEYALFCSFLRELRRYWGRIAGDMGICPPGLSVAKPNGDKRKLRIRGCSSYIS